jgi:hypothetical protein
VVAAGAVVATATAPSAAGGAANVADRTTWNDTGLGLRVIEESAGRIRWVVDRGIWARWNGKHWEDDHHASEALRHEGEFPSNYILKPDAIKQQKNR